MPPFLGGIMSKIQLKPKTKLAQLKQNLKSPIIKACSTEKEDDRYLYKVDSGSWALNLALTNNIDSAYPVGRVINAVGDFSTGKTLMACELVNSVWYIEHLIKGKRVKIYYDESEFAFDIELARKFNMPLEHMIGVRERLPDYKAIKGEKQFNISRTVEDLYTNINMITAESCEYDIILYIKDSLDSLSDAREITHIEKKGVGKQDYGGGKPRVMSQMFRNCIEGINTSNVLLFIISQVRDNFGAMFGPKYVRSGGKALDHYASVIYWLREAGKIEHPGTGLIQGIEAEIHVTKNKVGERYNKLTLNILHGYGVDNYGSAVNYLWDNKLFKVEGAYLNWDGKKMYRNQLMELASKEQEVANQLKAMWQAHWLEQVEKSKPNRPPKWGA
jgi:RecA/RadA recombinase